LSAVLPGCSVLHNIQVQLADDSLHAVRIAFRQKIEASGGSDRSTRRRLTGACEPDPPRQARLFAQNKQRAERPMLVLTVEGGNTRGNGPSREVFPPGSLCD
jgi:hypothetical protein